MALVHIARAHRADYATDLDRCGLGSYTALIDTQPNILEGVAASLPDAAQCAGCNFLDFLAGTSDLGPYRGLAQIRGFFAALPDVLRALQRQDREALEATCARLGAGQCYEVLRARARAELPGLPKILLIQAPDEGGPFLDLVGTGGDLEWVLIEPNRRGPAWVAAQLARAAELGTPRVLIGYHRHAAAMEHWSDFVEAPGFADDWPAMLARAATLGLGKLGLVMAYPACASLQWRANLPLERMRAQLDLSFRRVAAEASLMCPENVSGYSLTNDTRAVLASTAVARRSYAIRFENLVVCSRRPLHGPSAIRTRSPSSSCLA